MESNLGLDGPGKGVEKMKSIRVSTATYHRLGSLYSEKGDTYDKIISALLDLRDRVQIVGRKNFSGAPVEKDRETGSQKN